MVKVRGAYNKPFWIYKRLNNCAAPAPASDDVLVVEEEVFLCAGHAKEAGPFGHVLEDDTAFHLLKQFISRQCT